jgi:hypothetical protein
MLTPEVNYVQLETNIMHRIEHFRIVRARLYIGIHSVSACVAIIACVPVIQSFITSASQSGFTSYVSLLISDGAYVLGSWKELAFSIIDSTPIVEVALMLGLILVLGNALRRGSRYLSIFKNEHHVAVLS